nr:PREDICTED: uncharacterized protein LOC105269797 [Fopius arisanus]
MWKSADLGRSLTRFCALFMYSGAIFFQAKTILAPEGVDHLNITMRQHVLPRYDYIVDSQITPVFEIAYGTHTLLMVFLYTIEIAMCNLAAVFVGHICGQVQVMKLKLNHLENIANAENPNVIDDAISSLVLCHVKTITLFENIHNALCEICLIEVIYSIVVMCWLEFYCLREWRNNNILSFIAYITLFVALSFNILILCYIGEVAKNECESVARLAYDIAWYRLPAKKLSSFILIMAVARYPRSITAGGMMQMTLRNFTTVSN